MTVREISNQTGDVGKYFMFHGLDFTSMVGENWDGRNYEIVQNGSRSWEGRIDVWKKEDTSAGMGKKSYGAAAGDWKVNDTIELKSCRNPGKIFSFHYQIISYYSH